MKSSQSDTKIDAPQSGERLVLHACCGPCTLEPYKILHDAGWNITIMYSNSNIFPKTEFERRFTTLENWANENDALLIKDNYDETEWSSRVVKYGEAEANTPKRLERCGECYQLRLEHAAKFASANDIKYLSSTLAVSPYQYYEELKHRLEIVCEQYKLKPVFMDFRPFYREATRESKEQNMYRQKYCGCAFSYNESMEQFKRTNKTKYIEELKTIISD